jgi:hypothetical protein
MKTLSPKNFEKYLDNLYLLIEDSNLEEGFYSFCEEVHYTPTFEDGLLWNGNEKHILRKILKKSKKIDVDRWLDENDHLDLDWDLE